MDADLPMTPSISRNAAEYVQKLTQHYNTHLEGELNRGMKKLVNQYETFRERMRDKLVSETPSRFPSDEKGSIVAQIERTFLCNVSNFSLEQGQGLFFSALEYAPSKRPMFTTPPELRQPSETSIVSSDGLSSKKTEKTTEPHLESRNPSPQVPSHDRLDLNKRRRRNHSLENLEDTQTHRSSPASSTKKPLQRTIPKSGRQKLILKKQNNKRFQRSRQKNVACTLTSSITVYYPKNFVFSYTLNDDTSFYILSCPKMSKGCHDPIFNSDPFEDGLATAHFKNCGIAFTSDDEIVRTYARRVKSPRNAPVKQSWVKEHNDGLKAGKPSSPQNPAQISTCHGIPVCGKETKGKPGGTESNKDSSFEPESDDHRDELAMGSHYGMD
ncbi:hypothetical protein CPAR01_02299 [Colletotrichum paranaense]|uniref:Uncharacterized protein n=1 Tax=Colletotrichum paranaense TaxID=1914294 RepID=A0ABQ9SZ40_9PEZI|nr:uncharacterized protein CPAR01_02299 [Colletotrichum paranaense]KAK1544797.1 hypothetical protein CPAR01_02299 [Colletotrichum paranaense]